MSYPARRDRARAALRAALGGAARWGHQAQVDLARSRLRGLSALEALERCREPLPTDDLDRLRAALAAIPQAHP